MNLIRLHFFTTPLFCCDYGFISFGIFWGIPPYANQAMAQQAASENPAPAGMIRSSRMTQNRIKKLEKGNLQGPEGIVLHRTVSSTTESTLNSFSSTGIGTHFIVGKDGEIIQTATLSNKTFHVGKTKNEGDPNNSNSIGIEVVGNYNAETGEWEPLTDEQAASTADLVNVLYDLFNLDVNNVKNQEDISAKTAGEGETVRKAIENCIDNCKNDEN